MAKGVTHKWQNVAVSLRGPASAGKLALGAGAGKTRGAWGQ